MVGVLLLLSACNGSGDAAPTTAVQTSTTTSVVLPPELALEFDLSPLPDQAGIRVPLTGALGERVSVVGLGAERAPALRLVDGAGREVAAGVPDDVMVDFADLEYEIATDDELALIAEPADGRPLRRLTLRVSAGVIPTVTGPTRAEVPPGTTFRYAAAGDVVGISTNGVFDNPNYRINGAIVFEQLEGTARFSQSAETLDSFRGLRWYTAPGTYEVTVTGEISRLSIGTLETGLASETDIAAACDGLDAIQRRQAATGADLRSISEVIGRSITGGSLDAEWLEDLKAAVEAAEPGVEALRAEYDRARESLPTFFGQDLVDVQNGVYSSWVRLRDATDVAVSARQFFEEIAIANDSRLLRIGESAGLAFNDLDEFTTQVCGFSIRAPEFGIEA